MSSGLAAITTPLLAYLKSGDHMLMPDSVYGPGRVFAEGVLRRLGVTTTFYDPMIDAAGLTALMRPNTTVLYLESPGSHTFEVQDAPALAAAAHAQGATVMMDNTWGIHFFQPFAHGVDVSIQALTKYVVGHSDVCLGAVTVNREADWERVRTTTLALGQYASPDDCWLALRGVRTMAVRLDRQMESALIVARWLAGREEVARVLHPALPSLPRPRVLAARLFRRVQPVRRRLPPRLLARGGARDGGKPRAVRHRLVLGRVRESRGADQRFHHPQRRRRRPRRRGGAAACRAGATVRPDRRPRTRAWRAARVCGLSMTDTVLDAIRFDAQGLVPAIAQQFDTGEVLMVAWMNRAAVAETLATGHVCYFSRSRDALWRKGETSGQVQHLVELRLDCDGDALLLLVDQTGVACHTGRRSCFYRAAQNGALQELADPRVAPETLYAPDR